MSLALTLPIRQMVEFLLQSGSIDSRSSGFDRAQEGARLHRMLQRAAVKSHPDYEAEVSLKQSYTAEGIDYCLEGRADGIFTAEDGVATIDEIKTTTLPVEQITGEQTPAHWAQGQVYAAIWAGQQKLDRVRVQLTYYQVDEALTLRFDHLYSAAELNAIVTGLLIQYAPWARRSAEWKEQSRASLAKTTFPFASYRPGQRALAGEVYKICTEGGRLLCQAPTGIGKTISVLFPALKALADGPVFYLTARGTTQTAAEQALDRVRSADPAVKLRSITLTAKDKICLCENRECTPEACPYANGYYDRVKDALWDALDTCGLTAASVQKLAQKHCVCPFELGLDLSLWCDVVIGDYNYLFDPVVCLRRFFDRKGDYLFLVDEAHNLPGRAREMHSASLSKSSVWEARKALGKGKSRLKTALGKVNECFVSLRHQCEEAGQRVLFAPQYNEALARSLNRLCEPLQQWLEEHRTPDDVQRRLLELFFAVRGWLRTADSYDDHFVTQTAVSGSEVTVSLLCLDPSAFLSADFSKGKAAVLFSATLTPAGYYRDLCGLPQARAVMLRSPFPSGNLALFCADRVSTRYKDRAESLELTTGLLAALVGARSGNYLAFFPSYAYLQQVWEHFTARYPDLPTLRQEASMDEDARAAFLAHFSAPPADGRALLGFAVLGGVFGEGVDLAGDKLIGAAIVGPGLPQVNARQEHLRDYFEQSRGAGFDYAYRFPGMNKVLQAAGRVIRTPEDRGVVLLIDDRFLSPDYRRLMPPHGAHLAPVPDAEALSRALTAFWGQPPVLPESDPAAR